MQRSGSPTMATGLPARLPGRTLSPTATVSHGIGAPEQATMSHRPDGGVSINFRTDSVPNAVAGGNHASRGSGGGGGGGRADAGVQSRFDYLRSLLSDTREQLHESSMALSPALGIPDVDDTDMDTTRRGDGAGLSGNGVSFGGLDASSILGTVRPTQSLAQQSNSLPKVTSVAPLPSCTSLTLRVLAVFSHFAFYPKISTSSNLTPSRSSATAAVARMQRRHVALTTRLAQLFCKCSSSMT